MEGLCDLHTHSFFSDGTWSPSALIEGAERAGLKAVALCDHNTVAGLPEFLEAGRNSAVEAVAGVEFSTEYLGRELHILGLFIRPAYFGVITQRMEDLLRRKEQQNIVLCRKLTEHGLELDYEKIKADTPGGIVNRAVIGAEMVRLGYCESVKEAFSKWLSVERGFFQPPRRPDAYETIGFIKSIGAAAVLAHPFLNLDEQELRNFLPKAVEAGLDGMEVHYSRYDTHTTILAGAIAEEFHLIASGGSDFHGRNKADIQLGSGTGELKVPALAAEALRLRAEI